MVSVGSCRRPEARQLLRWHAVQRACTQTPLPPALPCHPPTPMQRGVGTAAGVAKAFKKETEDAAAWVKRQTEMAKR